jgi:hypothetical protein
VANRLFSWAEISYEALVRIVAGMGFFHHRHFPTRGLAYIRFRTMGLRTLTTRTYGV